MVDANTVESFVPREGTQVSVKRVGETAWNDSNSIAEQKLCFPSLVWPVGEKILDDIVASVVNACSLEAKHLVATMQPKDRFLENIAEPHRLDQCVGVARIRSIDIAFRQQNCSEDGWFATVPMDQLLYAGTRCGQVESHCDCLFGTGQKGIRGACWFSDEDHRFAEGDSECVGAFCVEGWCASEVWFCENSVPACLAGELVDVGVWY